MELTIRRVERVAEANRRLALTDPLTGLPNRRHLEHYLDRVLVNRAPRGFSLVVFDVDDFKRFNDHHGWTAGDHVLAAVGGVLANGCAPVSPHSGWRNPDDRSGTGRRPSLGAGDRSRFAARLGGDEFAVVLPGHPPGQAREAARRMAKSVAEHRALSRLGVTVGFGVAAPNVGVRGWREVLAAAGQDLRRRRSVQVPLFDSRHAEACHTFGRIRPVRARLRGARGAGVATAAHTPSVMPTSHPPGIELGALEEAAEELARAAGAVALRYFGTPMEVETKADDTPVTIADREAERLLRAEIRRRFPDHGIVGEEHGAVRAGAPVRWILDPIDGTKSFVHGVPLWGVLIGIEVEGEPSVGVVHLPALGETLTAARGRGCRWNGAPCSVSGESRLDRSLVATTDESVFHGHPAEAGWRALAAAARVTRSWGDCYGHVLVATGRAQVMVDPVLASWDAAPLLTILTEAGGCFTDMSGEPTIHGGSGVSANPALHPRVLGLLAGKR